MYKFKKGDSVELVHDEDVTGTILELVTSDNNGELVEREDDQNPWYIIEWEEYSSFDPEEHLLLKKTN